MSSLIYLNDGVRQSDRQNECHQDPSLYVYHRVLPYAEYHQGPEEDDQGQGEDQAEVHDEDEAHDEGEATIRH